jgi:carboxylesterase type B
MLQLTENSSTTDPLDVMFWIHGGGWFSGSGNSDTYGPQYLLDKDVVLVTINYRLGPLGKFQMVYVHGTFKRACFTDFSFNRYRRPTFCLGSS